LKVISGYHDTVSIDEGNTWFVGTSQTEPKKYYWRKADHSKCQNGHFAANAWSEWKEITCAVSPYQNMVRPVVYRSRLYLLWTEQQIRKDRDGDDDILSYTLKLTHIKYDGSWASPFSYDVTPKFSELTGQDAGLYCAADYENDILSCIFYTKEKEGDEQQSTVTPKEYAGLHILADMEQTPFLGIDSFIKTVIPQLDTVNISRINTTLENMNAPTLDPEEQQGSPDLALGLDLISYNLRKEDQKYFLSAEPVADVTINVSTIPEPLRALFAAKYSGGNYALYEFTDTSFSSENTDIPGGKCSLHLLYDKARSTSYLYLTLPSGNKQPDFLRDLLLTIKTDYTHQLSGNVILQWESSDSEYHYFSSRPIMTGNPLTNQNAELNKSAKDPDRYLGSVKTGKPELILPENYPACPELRIIDGDRTVLEFTQSTIPNHPAVLSDGSFHFDSTFNRQSLDVTAFVKNNQLNLPFKIDFKRVSNAKISGSRNYNLTMKVSAGNSSAKTGSAVISLHTTPDGARYMEWDAYRTRLNTLFARQLIARANSGIDAVLSPETQNLREPKPGEGTYVTLTLKPYDPAIHGSDRRFTIYYSSVFELNDKFPVYSGTLSSDTNTEIKLFIPRMDNSVGEKDNLYLKAEYQKQTTKTIRLQRVTKSNPHGWILDPENNTFPGLESVSGLSQPDEPMDFSGANALYFWELFYYTPMMVAMRLLQEQNFTEANRWLSYIWRPAATGAGDWRVRPLLEDTSWNADPLDSVDPDAVAQNDPMHYKVSTIMKMLDLLIARGDSAYRMLERDTLNEAKMWYMQALGLLGDKPVTVISGNWNNPALSEAADDTREQQRHQAISALRHGGLVPERHSANTLTGLFLPQQNEKLLGYWQTLEMRLFNLRNNLAIDGQPLSLPIFAAPADPAALLSAAAAASGGSKALPSAAVPA
ncbi:TPA: insecticidal toxin protein, partial [Morganella morganii]|nr:insecticidal toxin protein [Morganella morganii]